MITTGNTAKNYISLNGITIIDDINSSNKDRVFDIIANSTLRIDKKFPVPLNNNEIISKKSETISKIYEKLTHLNNDVINNKGKEITNETQFRSFKAKVLFWCSELFSKVIEDLDNSKSVVIVIENDISKHESMFVQWLAEFGAKFLIISNKVDIINDKINIEKIKFGTNEHIEYDATSIDNKSNAITRLADVKVYNSLDDIETALYENKDTVKVIVSGVGNYNDTCNFYGKLYLTCSNNNDFMLFDNGFRKPTYEQTQRIPRINNKKTDYIINTLVKFLDVKDANAMVELQQIILNYFNNDENKQLTNQIIYNKMTYAICCINNIFNARKPKCIVYYGKMHNSDTCVLDILSNMSDLSIVVASSDKSKINIIKNMAILELENSMEIFAIPVVDRRNGSVTMAVQAQERVNQTLFSGDTLGMYKPGQFLTCDTIDYNTIYDEIKLWWNKEMYLRPGFEAVGSKCVLPVMFKLIHGSCWEPSQYIQEVQKYCCGKTIICRNVEQLNELYITGSYHTIHRLTDINGTLFSEQKPFVENGKINKKRIKTCKNYHYSMLSESKQNLILDKIEELLNNDKVNKQLFGSQQDYMDAVLNVGLNMNTQIVQYIQWFEFYTYNPNVVVTLKDDRMPNVYNLILLELLRSLGFDILIFVPTCYRSIEGLCGPQMVYNVDVVGEAMYNIETNALYLSNNIEIPTENKLEPKKKQGIFSKLFGK